MIERNTAEAPRLAALDATDLANAKVGELARDYPASIRVFQRHGIDFCCGGKRTVADAAQRAQANAEALLADLYPAVIAPGGTASGWDLPDSLADLGKLIVGRYHVALRRELPRLVAMANRVEQVHGAAMPETLPALAAHVRELAAELDRHMIEEEDTVFPAIERLERAARRGEPVEPRDLAGVVAAREDEHTAAGERLATLRELSNRFTPPEWACNTFRGLYYGLSELERELHEHIHLENNVLFPRAMALAGA
jgi:regulator of cell morphogenesis and NO signaling